MDKVSCMWDRVKGSHHACIACKIEYKTNIIYFNVTCKFLCTSPVWCRWLGTKAWNYRFYVLPWVRITNLSHSTFYSILAFHAGYRGSSPRTGKFFFHLDNSIALYKQQELISGRTSKVSYRSIQQTRCSAHKTTVWSRHSISICYIEGL